MCHLSAFGLKPSSRHSCTFGVAPSPLQQPAGGMGLRSPGAELCQRAGVSLSKVLRWFTLRSQAPNRRVSRRLRASHVSAHLAGPLSSVPPPPWARPGHACPDPDTLPPGHGSVLVPVPPEPAVPLPAPGLCWSARTRRGKPGRVKPTSLQPSSQPQPVCLTPGARESMIYLPRPRAMAPRGERREPVSASCRPRPGTNKGGKSPSGASA